MKFAPEFVRWPEASRIIRERLALPDGATNPLLSALEEGALSAQVLTDASWAPVTAAWWHQPPIAWPSPYTQALPGQITPAAIRIARVDLDRLWPERGADALAPVGGRPAKHDWDGAFIEMARVAVFEDDCSRSLLMQRVAEWFSATGQSEPTQSEIRKRVKRFHETLWPPKT